MQERGKMKEGHKNPGCTAANWREEDKTKSGAHERKEGRKGGRNRPGLSLILPGFLPEGRKKKQKQRRRRGRRRLFWFSLFFFPLYLSLPLLPLPLLFL